MNIVVIGLGSMGKRRIRLIKEMFPYYEICGVDSRKDRQREVENLFKIKIYDSVSFVPSNVDCAFVCTSPLSHANLIKECLTNKWNVFTELNLISDGYDDNIRLASKNNCKLFLSSTFLYREEIKYIRSKIDNKQKWNYVYHVGQYLPDWHPWENINDYFIGNKKTNGCREIMAIELPWLTRTFGQILKVKSISDKMSSLKIDYNDNFCIQLEHKNGNKGVLVADVVCPVAVRNFHAYAEERYISWNGTPDSLYELCNKKLVKINLTESAEHTEGYSNFIVENAYKNEIKEFFDVVNKQKIIEYGFEDDKEILKIIDSIGA